MAKRILDKGYEYYGIDVSELLVDAASDRCREYVDEGKAHFIAGNIEKNFNLDSGVFDAVLVCGSLQYLGSPSNCFKEVSRVLKDNGAFIVCQANMYSLRKMVHIMKEEYLYFPCFKSILTDTKLKKYFGRYKEYKWMSSKFMTKGSETHVYDIKKRMYSYWRLKKILQNEHFKVTGKRGATFLFPKNNKFYNFFTFLDSFLQKISDMKLLPFFYSGADNIILSTKKHMK
jgi:ubiquinone/menaquinone biosynthesis C-methylase UbiE